MPQKRMTSDKAFFLNFGGVPHWHHEQIAGNSCHRRPRDEVF